MNIARQIPRVRGIRCCRQTLPASRYFSAGALIRNDTKQEPSSPAIPEQPQQPPPAGASRPIEVPPSQETITAPTQEFFDMFDQVLRNTRGPKVKLHSDAADPFTPASLAQMPFNNPATSATTRKLTQIQPRLTEHEPGYFFVHAVSVTRNIHVTICDHKHNPVIAVSAGQLGKKHSKRGTPEAAYDTTVRALERLAISPFEVRQVELVLKGFGNGRRGFLQAIMGPKGEFVKRKVVRVTDATPLQIGQIKAPNEKRR